MRETTEKYTVFRGLQLCQVFENHTEFVSTESPGQLIGHFFYR